MDKPSFDLSGILGKGEFTDKCMPEIMAAYEAERAKCVDKVALDITFNMLIQALTLANAMNTGRFSVIAAIQAVRMLKTVSDIFLKVLNAEGKVYVDPVTLTVVQAEEKPKEGKDGGTFQKVH